MNKKYFIFTIISSLACLVIYFIIFSVQNYLIKKSLREYTFSYYTENLVEYDTIRCNYNIFNPKVAFVDKTKRLSDQKEELAIDFHFVKNIFSIKNNDWNYNYLGSTDIKNTTFPQLLAMVKEDCGRFQEDYDNPDKNGIDWGYREAPTKEEIEREKGEAIEKTKADLKSFSEKAIQRLKNDFGYYPDFTDEELYKWRKETDFKGFDPEA